MYYKVALALPTNSEIDKISMWLKNIEEGINFLNQDKYKVSIVIGLNGIAERIYCTDTKRFKKLLKCGRYSVDVLLTNTFGKNDCMNYIVSYCRKADYDIIHFFDDDVVPEVDSISLNLEELTSTEKSPVIVGANFFVNDKSLNWLSKILYAPYQKDSDVNDFIAGYSNCTWLEYYPKLPPTSSMVAEDSFVSIYFSKIGDGKDAIKKPEKSIVYFEPYLKYSDWFWTQVRTYVGIEKSFLKFDLDYYKYQVMFSWRYAEDKRFRDKKRRISLISWVKLITFRLLQRRVYKVGQEYLKELKMIDWNKNE